MMARTIATAVFVLLAGERIANAAPAIDLTVDERAKGCPSAEELRAEVARQVGEDRVAAARVDVRIGVELDGSLAARLGLADDPTRTQTLHAPARACRDLTNATAIAVSLLLRAAASAHPAPPPPPPPPSLPPKPPPVLPPPRPAFRHSLATGIVLGRGVVPDLAVGPLFTYGLRWKRYFGVAVDASTTISQTTDGPHGSAVRVTSHTFSLAPCGYLGFEFACVFVAAGDLAGTGEHVRNPTTRRFANVELGYRIGVRVPLPASMRLRLELRNGFPLVRSDLRVDGDTVWRSPPVTLTGGLSLETSF